jgi:quinohemoprotein ethanol dehydrogenase
VTSRLWGWLAPFGVAILLAGCGQSGDKVGALKGTAVSGPVDDARLDAAHLDPANWLQVGGGRDEQHFSALTQITAANVASMKPAWSFDYDTMRGQEGEPLVVDGVMYVSTAWSKVYALDAASGKQLWQYDPKVPGAAGFRGCCDVVNRGVAYYKGRVYVGTFDGRLAAIDARTGREVWAVNTVDQTKMYTITGAPRIVKGKVIIGNGGAEYSVRGYVTAYDADTGRKIWRFYTVPGDPAKRDGEISDEPLERLARGTWFGNDYWKGGGGGTAWDSIVYDRDLDQLYVGVGNGSPHSHLKRSQGKGDNVFLASILALDPDTGKYLWHYQQVPGESWDYTSVQNMVLADLPIGGKDRKVLLHAPKNGFFYVIDRSTGRPISADAFVDDIRWAKGIDPKTWRPVDVPGSRYTEHPFLNSPGPAGGHNFQPMAFSPATKLVYIPTSQNYWTFGADQPASHEQPDAKATDMPAAENYLQAWDPIRRRTVWRAKVTNARLDVGGGGVLATAGNLVFQGRGEIIGEMMAFKADDGKLLWRYDMPNAVMAAPISYMVKGVQYVAVSTGAGGPVTFGSNTPPRERQVGRMVVFKLGGTAVLPSPPPLAGPAHVPTEKFASAHIAEGEMLYTMNCGRCHGMGTRASNLLPDLRRSGANGDAGVWRQIVIDGALTDNGMVSFSDKLTPAQAESIRAWVGSEAAKLAANQKAGKPER